MLLASGSANAFGSISKQEITAATKEREPAWLPLTQWTYKQPSRMCIDDAPPHAPPVLAHTGTQQGLPMDPTNSAVSLQSTGRLERAAERHPDAPQLSFLDECHTIGCADACIAAVQG